MFPIRTRENVRKNDKSRNNDGVINLACITEATYYIQKKIKISGYRFSVSAPMHKELRTHHPIHAKKKKKLANLKINDFFLGLFRALRLQGKMSS